MVDVEFWNGRRVFVTGHTGFKGSWLSLWLQSMGANVKGYALEAPTDPSLFLEARVAAGMASEIGDIRDIARLKQSIESFAPELIIHMAAQPLVRFSYKNPVDTYSVNVMGTVNLLEVARNCESLKAIVNVTTDKCYENREWVWGYRETDPMGGFDPYSNSKGCAELVTSAFRSSFFGELGRPAIATARAGNVIGGGDWADDRLIPDILRAFEKADSVLVRNPMATRPWQHVLEPLSGYLVLAQKLIREGQRYAGAWNFGPFDQGVKPVKFVLEKMVSQWGQGAAWEQENLDQPHEATLLKLDISKANNKLGWYPKWSLDESIELIIDWHRSYIAGYDMRRKTLEHIQLYMQDIRENIELNSLATRK